MRAIASEDRLQIALAADLVIVNPPPGSEFRTLHALVLVSDGGNVLIGPLEERIADSKPSTQPAVDCDDQYVVLNAKILVEMPTTRRSR